MTDAHGVLQGWDCGSLTFRDDPSASVARSLLELPIKLPIRFSLGILVLECKVHYFGQPKDWLLVCLKKKYNFEII